MTATDAAGLGKTWPDKIPDIHHEIISEMHESGRTLVEYPKYLYLGVSQYARLLLFAKTNLKMFMVDSAEEWGKERFLNMQIIRVDKFNWLKVGP